MATRTLYTGSITATDLKTVYSVKQQGTSKYSVRYRNWSIPITQIDLIDTYNGVSGYKHALYARLTYNACSSTTGSVTASGRVATRAVYSRIIVNDTNGSATTFIPYSVTAVDAGTKNTGSFVIDLSSSESTFTINNLSVSMYSTSPTGTAYSTIFTYSGDPIIINLPAQTKSKLTLSNTTPTGASITWPSGWSSTNYLTIGESYTPGRLMDANGLYRFTGWYTDSERTIPASFPFTATNTDLTLYSGWTEVLKGGRIKVDGNWVNGTIKMRVGDTIQSYERGYVKVNGLWLPLK